MFNDDQQEETICDSWDIEEDGKGQPTGENAELEYNSDSEGEDQQVEFQDLQLFLHAIGEPQLVDHFIGNKITLGQLLEFNEQDLIHCGIELVGDRKKILENTYQIHSEKWHPTSLHDLNSKTILSSPGIYIALNDINKHIEYIGITFKFFKRRLEERPEMLELGKDYVGVAKIASELDDLMTTTKNAYNQLRKLERELLKHSDDPHKRPANHIDERYVFRAKVRRNMMPALVVTFVAFASVKAFRWVIQLIK